jgi:signal transduction histidine kinase
MSSRLDAWRGRWWPHPPGRTIRLRLTLAYWLLFIVSAAALLALTVGLWRGASRTLEARVPAPAAATGVAGPSNLTATQRHRDLQQLLVTSAEALAIMAVPAIALGWLLAGRYLRPLRTITATARQISATNLHQRLGLHGPRDELTQLGDTFDELLDRLERSFEAERQFAANAAHELRTPHTTMRVWLDVAMAKPDPLPAHVLNLYARLRDELDHSDQLLDGLLTLAQSQRTPFEDASAVSLSELASTALQTRTADITDKDLNVEVHLRTAAEVTGSAALLARLVDNLLDNAIKHNQPEGWIRLSTTVDESHARLTVENGGPVLDQGDVERLARPFQRLDPERTGSQHSTGLGLSIVQAIAQAHQGTLQLAARPGGGMQAVVELPHVPAALIVALP